MVTPVAVLRNILLMVLRETYRIPGIKPESAACEVSVLPSTQVSTEKFFTFM